MSIVKIHLIASVASIALLAQPALAANDTPTSAGTTSNTTAPRNLQDDAYVTLSGTVGKILGKNAFELNYKGGMIKVTTDEAWNSLYDTKSAYSLKTGQRVTVSGIVDDNWFTRKEIDAHAVNVMGQGGQAYSYNRGNDAKNQNMNDSYYLGTATHYVGEGSQVMLSGVVTKVEGDDFWLRYGNGTIMVDGDKLDLPDNRIAVGNRVMVRGEVNDPLFQKKQIEASSVTVIDMYRVPVANTAGNR